MTPIASKSKKMKKTSFALSFLLILFAGCSNDLNNSEFTEKKINSLERQNDILSEKVEALENDIWKIERLHEEQVEELDNRIYRLEICQNSTSDICRNPYSLD